jgi:hypothetical protein
MSDTWQRLRQPVQLPPGVARWLPKSFTVTLGAAALLALWSSPLFAPPFGPFFGRAVSGWGLKPFAPWAATVPVTALLLLMTGWTGDRRNQAWCLLALCLQAIGIAVCVPLGPYPHAAWLYLALFVITVSWIRDAVVARALARGEELRIALRLRAGLLAVGASMLLWVPFVMSRGFPDRWDNPLYAGLAQMFGKQRPDLAPGKRPQIRTQPRPAPLVPPSSPVAPSQNPRDYTQYEQPAPPLPTFIPSACNTAQETSLEAQVQALENAMAKEGPLTLEDVDQRRTNYLRKLVDVRLGGPIRAGLGHGLDSLLERTIWMYQRAPVPSADWRAPPDLSWMRPLVAREVAAWSFEGATSANPRQPLNDAVTGSTPRLRIFPIGLSCEHLEEPARFEAKDWIYPRIVAGSAAPPSIRTQGENTVVSFEPVSLSRAAGVVDYARFIGAPVSVELTRSASDEEIYPTMPSRGERKPPWSIVVTTDLPALILQEGKLIPGRLVRATGGDVCRSSAPGFEVVTKEMLTGIVEGLILSANASNDSRMVVLGVVPGDDIRNNIRRLRRITKLDLDADGQADLSFELNRFQWQKYEANASWNDTPSYRGRVLVSEGGAQGEADTVSYVNCERM